MAEESKTSLNDDVDAISVSPTEGIQSRMTMVEMADHIELDDALEKIGFGKVQLGLMITSLFITMSNLNETMGAGIIAPASKCDLDATTGEILIMQTVAFGGVMVSSFLWGYLTDLIGRHKVLMYTITPAMFFSVLSMLMPNYELFIILRFLVGFFVAGPSFVVLPYLGEFCSNSHRPHIINFLSLASGLGMIYCPLLATFLLQEDWYVEIGTLEFRPWRLLGLMYTVPGILGLICLSRLPETPKFLLSVDKDDEALYVLEWMCKTNRDEDLEDIGILHLTTSLQPKEPHDRSLWQQLLDDIRILMMSTYIYKFMISFVIMFGLVIVTNGMGIWFCDMRNRMDVDDNTHDLTICDTILAKRENDIEVDAFICNDSFISFTDSILMGVTFIISYQVLSVLLWIFPRKVVYIAPLIVSFFCGLSLNWAQHNVAIRVFFMLFISLPGVVINLLGGAIIDFVPTNLRGKGVCLCMVFGRIGIVVGSTILGYVLDNYCVLAFNIFTCFPLVCAILGYFLPF